MSCACGSKGPTLRGVMRGRVPETQARASFCSIEQQGTDEEQPISAKERSKQRPGRTAARNEVTMKPPGMRSGVSVGGAEVATNARIAA